MHKKFLLMFPLKKTILIMLTVCFACEIMGTGMTTAGRCSGCGAAGKAVDALLGIPASLTSSPEYPDHYGCRDDNSCGPVGGLVDWLLAIPNAALGMLTSYPKCHCENDKHNSARYPRGCMTHRFQGVAADADSQSTGASPNQMPAYITYSTVDPPVPAKPVPPVITFNGPLTFEHPGR